MSSNLSIDKKTARISHIPQYTLAQRARVFDSAVQCVVAVVTCSIVSISISLSVNMRCSLKQAFVGAPPALQVRLVSPTVRSDTRLTTPISCSARPTDGSNATRIAACVGFSRCNSFLVVDGARIYAGISWTLRSPVLGQGPRPRVRPDATACAKLSSHISLCLFTALSMRAALFRV